MPENNSRNIVYSEAIREALVESMRSDESVVVIGEGVPDTKAIFGTAKGLQDEFGADRVFDMPLSENAMTGICIGAALSGMRPVLIHQRIDFAMLSMDQLVNNAAKWHYMFNGKASVPLVVRMIIGRGWGQGPQHSQSLQAMFAQVPGLKVVMPTTARDAKGMLIEAINDDNPVMFIEHRWLYHVEDVVPETSYREPLNKARCLLEGSDVTIAAFSLMSLEAYRAARVLKEKMNINVEVLDMRSVRPLDIDSVLESVSKTGRLLVADTGCNFGSIVDQVIGAVVDQGFDLLRARPARVTAPDHPVPTSHYAAEKYYPGAHTIALEITEMLGCDKESAEYADVMEILKPDARHDVPQRDFTGPF